MLDMLSEISSGSDLIYRYSEENKDKRCSHKSISKLYSSKLLMPMLSLENMQSLRVSAHSLGMK